MLKPEILFEDDDYVILNKPSGMRTIPDRHNENLPSLSGLLRTIYGEIFIVHRLDMNTSGCVCFAKNAEAHRYASQLFEHRQVEKKYLGIVYGSFEEPEGLIEDPIMEHPVIKGKMIVHQKQGKPSSTSYKVLENFSQFSLVEFIIHTGRTHQIRVHMQNAGHPILCDEVYGSDKPIYISSMKKRYNLSKHEDEEKPILHRMALHAHSLKFISASGKQIEAVARLPKDMNAMLNQCRKWLS
ncbi:MAG: RluA family pseudouridine synthase [Chitinophagaceae bacterium]|nr:RluA family pseudouridine synthase [Chitinophagaceae bacterium]